MTSTRAITQPPDPATTPVQITGGVDTHKDTHTAAALDPRGQLLGHAQFDTTPTGITALVTWLRSFGTLVLVGIEGTGSYGVGLTRYLTQQSVTVVEVNKPDRATRRLQGKSDPLDAEAAARAAQTGRRTSTPKGRDGRVEALRTLRIARKTAVNQRADLQRRIKDIVVTAPEPLRDTLRVLNNAKLIRTCADAEPNPTQAAQPATATQLALRSMARAHLNLSVEIRALDALINPLVAKISQPLLDLPGVGPDVAAQLLITAGENPQRLHSEGAFAMLCGVAPIPASSGKTNRHRLNRGGDRHANSAIWRITITRMKDHQPTRDYVTRRTEEGLTKIEIMRCLKRYIAREIFNILVPTPEPQPAAA